MTLLSKRQQSSIDAGQMDLFMIGTMSPHQRRTVFGHASKLEADDFASIVAQEVAKRALEIAAVANHSLQFIGSAPEIEQLIIAGRKIGAGQCFHSHAGGAALDLNVEVRPTQDYDLRLPPPAESSAEISERVERAKVARPIIMPLSMDAPCVRLLRDAAAAMRLSDKLLCRVMGVAQSIAALADVEALRRIHIAEALSYVRMPPREPEPEPEPCEEDEPDACLRAWAGELEVVEVDPKRLKDNGDISRSYSAQSLYEHGAVRSPFRLRGCEWVQIGGCYFKGSRSIKCYRLVAPEAFDGPTAPYRDHDWRARGDGEEFGPYHGMSAKHGSREIVLQGPPIVVVDGAPEQSALL